ncbi:hypothetical protein INT44_003811 [Umbelopsis vinacea]|uniref:FAD dependent oxidoreductase domain-containing protein n=1 Tax=Umbelopsis vinacea TaxID=44442 RepID=A0A8H7Q9V1_9FUNG|nr:hypothetical protein INT44_003811 [Umbelopsis vinacea]
MAKDFEGLYNPSTDSYWLNSAPWQEPSKSALPASSDVVIIGAGMSGLSTAYWLRKYDPKLNVVVIDARGISSGATGRNGGICLPGLNDSYQDTIDDFGYESAKKLLEFDHLTVDKMKQFVEEHCDTDKGVFDPEMTFLEEGGLILWSTIEQRDNGIKDAKAFIASGLGDDVRELSKDDVKRITGSDAFYGGLQVKTAAVLWAAKFVFCLARSVQDWCKLFTFCPAEEVTKTGDLFTVHTKLGKIKAKKVVYATNAWTKTILPQFSGRVTAVRNQVLQFRAPENVKWNYCMSSNDGYEYMSQRPNGDIVLGGMRNIVDGAELNQPDDSTLNETIGKALREFLPKHFPGFKDTELKIEKEWSGIMGFNMYDRLPFIGPLGDVPGRHDGEYACFAFTGHGMPRTFMAGNAIATMITGQPLPSWLPRECLPNHERRKGLWTKNRL